MKTNSVDRSHLIQQKSLLGDQLLSGIVTSIDDKIISQEISVKKESRPPLNKQNFQSNNNADL